MLTLDAVDVVLLSSSSSLVVGPLVVVFVPVAVAPSVASPSHMQDPKVLPEGHEVLTIEGWTVLVNERLRADTAKDTARALELLEGQLQRTEAHGFYVLDDELQITSRFVDTDVGADNDFGALFEFESQALC